MLGLTDLEPHEAGHGDSGLVEQCLDGLLVVRHRRLVQQHDVLVVARDATFDDLGQRLLGLALFLRGLLGDAPLVGDDVGGDVLTGEVLGLERGDLQGDRVGGLLALLRVTGGVLDQDTDGRRQVRGTLVQVGLDRAVEVGDPTQFELLADLGGQVGDGLLDGGGSRHFANL